VLGGDVVRVAPVHGKTSTVHHDGQGLFAGLPATFEVARYHSLAVDPETCPPALRRTAFTEDGVIMGLRHAELPMAGVQFHPESFMTPLGPKLLANFLSPAFAEPLAANEADAANNAQLEAPPPAERLAEARESLA